MSSTITKLTPTSLAALLSARICHDLISPVGALGTALEILDDPANAEMHPDAMDLVRTSSRQATAKLKFLRLAFGAGGSAPGVIGVEEIKSLANDMFEPAKPDLAWDIDGAATADEGGIDEDRTRILLNLIMLAVQAAPRGGVVTVSYRRKDGGEAFTLTAEGNRVRLDAPIARALSRKMPEDGFDGRTIQPLYTAMLAQEAGGTVHAEATDAVVTFGAHFPAV